MANEKSDINDIVKKCKILLLDIEGTTTSISFVKDKLFPYAEEHVKDFLDNEWELKDVKEVVAALRKLALEDEENKVDGVVAIPADDASKDEQIEGLVKNVKWQMSSDRKVGPLKQLQGLIWKKGYDKGDIKGHVFDDVSPALEQWRSLEGRKVYIYSSGSVQAQKLLFGMSSAGDMLKLIDGHFDTAVGAKQESASYTAIAEKIGCKAEDILFLTDIDKEAEAARSAGVQAALVSREGNAPLSDAITSAYPVLYSFTELAVTNKRKTDAQDQQQPAKVPKTDVEADVKTPVDTSPQPENKSEEIEKMEVEEEENITKEETQAQKLTSEAVEHVKTIVEDITGADEVSDAVVSDAKPIITECTGTKMMETEPVEVVNSVSNGKPNGDEHESEESLITEIKDITDDKESLSEGTEIIEDLVPVVEEPVQDMEDLQNVGEVLEKECDEILSKVQDVTNLDNIPLKSLHPIAEEETMEKEDMDTNDIVERILDKEQELEMKKCEMDLNSVRDKSAAKPTTDADKSEILVPKEKPLETIVEEGKTDEVKEKHVDVKSTTEEKEKENSVSEEKVKESNVTEEKVNGNNMTEEKAKESATGETVKEISVPEEKVIETVLPEEKVIETVVPEEKGKETVVPEKKEKETVVPEKKGKETYVPEKNGKETVVPEKKGKETVVPKEKGEVSAKEEKVMETSVTKDIARETNLTQEKVKETTVAEEKVKSIPEEKVNEVSVTETKVKETGVTEEKVEKINLTEEKEKENDKMEDKVNEQTEDKAKESSQAEKKESNLSDDIVMKSSVTDGKVKDNSITEENVKEESLGKTSIMEKDLSSVEQKVKDGGSGKTEESKAIVDEVKSTNESIETQMEVDSTPETGGNKISIDAEKTEKKIETEKMEVEGEKSDAPSTNLSTETKAKIVKDEISMQVDQTETKAETKPTDKVATTTSVVETVQTGNDSKEVQVNGKATNGDADMVDLNGDASKDDELSSRLSMENGKDILNGANGDVIADAKTENKADDVKEVSDLKAKTVAMSDGQPNDPIEQPMEA